MSITKKGITAFLFAIALAGGAFAVDYDGVVVTEPGQKPGANTNWRYEGSHPDEVYRSEMNRALGQTSVPSKPEGMPMTQRDLDEEKKIFDENKQGD